MVTKLNEDEILRRVIQAVTEMLQMFNKNVSIALKKETNIFSDLGIDSVELMDLLGFLEKEFHITIEPEKAVGIKTINDIVKFISKS